MRAIKHSTIHLVAGLLVAAPAAEAAVVYDNGPVVRFNGIDSTSFIVAEDFSLGRSTTIGGGGIYVGDASPGIETWNSIGNELNWYIFADNFGQPGSVPLASGSAENVRISDSGVPFVIGPGNAFLAEFDLGTTFTAAENTKYWFGVHLDDQFQNTNVVYWATTFFDAFNNSQRSFEGEFDNWERNDLELAFFLTDAPSAPPLNTFAAELTAASPAVIEQNIDTPTIPFDFSFDFQFLTGAGDLSVSIANEEIFSVSATDFIGSDDFQTQSISVSETALLGLSGAPLAFRLDGPAGSQVLIDNVEYPDLVNGDFETGDLTGWSIGGDGNVSVVVLTADISEPGTAALVGSAFVALAFFRRRRG